jgi:hypothetical protein
MLLSAYVEMVEQFPELPTVKELPAFLELINF